MNATDRRSRLWRATHWVLAGAALLLFVAFTWQRGVASVGDDSVSYLLVARWLSGDADPLIVPWLSWHTHFGPLFPLALAVAGGGNDLLAAHLVVASFAGLSVLLLARFAATALEDDAAGLGLALAFLLMPTAWISVKGILSESLYLAATLGALQWHETRVVRESPRASTWLILGTLMAAALLTRTVGITLVAAYIARAVVAFATDRERGPGLWLPLAPVVILCAAWLLLRPGGQTYDLTVGRMVSSWVHDPAIALHAALIGFPGGWVASFMTDSEAPRVAAAVLYAVGAVAFAGTLRAVALNRLDGWYVLLSLGLVFAWPFGEKNTSRLLYPLVPLLLVHAAQAVLVATAMLRVTLRTAVRSAAFAVPFLLCVPATLLVAQKAFDREPLVPGSRYVAADITEYYTTVNMARARALAARHAAVLGGLERLSVDTEEGARVMWMRPEYVALLGARAGVPSYFGWDAARLAREIRDARADYLVVASLYKSDLKQNTGDGAVAFRDAQPYASTRAVLANPFTKQDEFVLLRVDRERLAAYLRP